MASPLSPNTAELSSIRDSLINGGYYFGSASLQLSDAADDIGNADFPQQCDEPSPTPPAAVAASAEAEAAAAPEAEVEVVAEANATPQAEAKTTAGTVPPPPPQAATATAARPTSETEANTMPTTPPTTTHNAPGAAAVNHKGDSSRFSLPGTTSTPSSSVARSTYTTPAAAHSRPSEAHSAGGGADESNRPRALLHSNDKPTSAGEDEARKMDTALSLQEKKAEQPSKRPSPTGTAASSPHRPLQPKAPLLSTRKLPAPLTIHAATTLDDCSTLSTPAVDKTDAGNSSTSARASSHPLSKPRKPTSPLSAPASNTRRRCTTTSAAASTTTTTNTTSVPPPPLSPKKAFFTPMQRVAAPPHTPSSSSSLPAGGATPPTPDAAAAAKAGLTSLLAVRAGGQKTSPVSPVSAHMSGSVTANSAVPNTTKPTSPYLMPLVSRPAALNTSALSAAHAGGLRSPLRPLTHSPAKASPLPQPYPTEGRTESAGAAPTTRLASSSSTSPTAGVHLGPPHHAPSVGSISESHAAAAPAEVVEDEQTAIPEAVPLWLAQLNHALLKNNNAAPQHTTSSDKPAPLANHRTSSQMVASAVDDWLNPCHRPRGGLAPTSPFYASTQPAAGAAGLPPGVTAALHTHHRRDEMNSSYTDDDDGGRAAGSSQTSLTDTNTTTSRGSLKNTSLSASDATGSASNRTAPFIGGRWKAEDGAPVHRQYPSRNPSLAGSVTSADNVGFVPISREQRTMSPQSQRWESSGCLSLYSSVAESALTEKQQQQQQQQQAIGASLVSGAPMGLGRRQESSSVTSRGSGDIMAPVRLGRHECRPAAALLASPTTTTTTAETSQPSEVRQEALVMPPMRRGFSLQPVASFSEDGAAHFTSPGLPQRSAFSMESALGSASVLSTNEGPSSMRLPLARFMRNPSAGSAISGLGLPQPQQQQQQPTAFAHPSSTSPTARCGGPAVLSLRPESPPTEAVQKDAHPTTTSNTANTTIHNNSSNNAHANTVNQNGNGTRRAPSWGRHSPFQQPLRQGQVQTLDDDLEFTASLTLTPTDAISNASRATSGLSLAAETTFVRCD